MQLLWLLLIYSGTLKYGEISKKPSSSSWKYMLWLNSEIHYFGEYLSLSIG